MSESNLKRRPVSADPSHTSTTCTSNDSTFRDAISETLGSAPDHLYPGRFVRWGANKHLYAMLLEDGTGVVFGNWKTGEKHIFFADKDNTGMSRQDIAKARRLAAAASRQRNIETAKRQAKSATEAAAIHQSASELPRSFDYLVSKQIETFAGIFRLHKDGRAIAPLETIDGTHVNNQYIAPNGEKRFHYGALVTAAFCVVQTSELNARIVICEGVATGCSLAAIEPDSTLLAAMNAGNLLPVARAVRSKEPHSQIIIAGDNDRNTAGNPGKTKAIEAARAVGGEYSLPEFPPGIGGTDFNDLACAGCLP